MNRREFVRTAGGVAAGGAVAAGAAGPAAAAEDGGSGEFDYGGWFGDVSNFESTQDMRGQSQVTVMVGTEGNGGNLAFSPPAIHVDPGTTVTWEWTGNGGTHNVQEDGGAWRSDLSGEAGFTYEQTFSEDGIVRYICSPHEASGMKGAVVVGDPSSAGPTPVNPEHMGVPFQPHFVGLATLLAVSVSLVFSFFLLKYGESAHTKGGND